MSLDPESVRDFAKAATSPIVGGIGGISGFLYAVMEHEREFKWLVMGFFFLLGAVVGGYGIEFIMERETRGYTFVVWLLGSVSYPLYGKGRDVFVTQIIDRLKSLTTPKEKP